MSSSRQIVARECDAANCACTMGNNRSKAYSAAAEDVLDGGSEAPTTLRDDQGALSGFGQCAVWGPPRPHDDSSSNTNTAGQRSESGGGADALSAPAVQHTVAESRATLRAAGGLLRPPLFTALSRRGFMAGCVPDA